MLPRYQSGKATSGYHVSASGFILKDSRPHLHGDLAAVQSGQWCFGVGRDRGMSGWPRTTVRHDRSDPDPLGHRAGRPDRPPSNCCRWSTTSCASWPRRSWPRRSRARRSTPRPWSMRRTCGSSAIASPQDRRRHFFAAAAEAMRRILIDNARRKATSAAWRRSSPGPPRRCSRGQYVPRRASGSRRCPDSLRGPRARQGRAGQAALLRPHEQPGSRGRARHLRRHRRALVGVRPHLALCRPRRERAQKNTPRHEGVGAIFSPKRVMRPREEADRDRDVSRRNRSSSPPWPRSTRPSAPPI